MYRNIFAGNFISFNFYIVIFFATSDSFEDMSEKLKKGPFMGLHKVLPRGEEVENLDSTYY